MPVDPVLAVVGDRAPADVYERARLELGLDKPLPVQFWIYLQKVFSGDFGKSVLTSNPVIEDIRRVFPATLELATLGTLIGISLAFRSACWLRRSRAAGPIISRVSSGFSAIPCRSSGSD